MRRSLLVSMALLCLTVAAPAAAAQDATTTVTVVHGIPNSPFDVYIDGELSLDDFQAGAVTDPIELAAGEHVVDVVSPDASDNSAPLLSVMATLEPDDNVSMVAHLGDSGEPGVDVFTNDTAPLDTDRARLTVRHLAVAPAVNVVAGDDTLVEGLANGEQTVTAVAAGDHDLALTAVDGGQEVLSAAGTTLAAGTNTIVYAVGSVDGGTMEALVQTIDDLGGEPEGVPAGSAGLVDGDRPLVAAALALVGLAALGFALRRRRVEA